jgi:hypothetical protein
MRIASLPANLPAGAPTGVGLQTIPSVVVTIPVGAHLNIREKNMHFSLRVRKFVLVNNFYTKRISFSDIFKIISNRRFPPNSSQCQYFSIRIYNTLFTDILCCWDTYIGHGQFFLQLAVSPFIVDLDLT